MPSPSNHQRLLIVLWVCSTIFLFLGLTRPAILISVNIEGVLRDAINQQPIVGLLLQEKGFKLSEIASRLPPSSTTQQSIISSALKLYHSKSYIAAAMIFLFSIILPILKQITFLALTILPGGTSPRLLKVIQGIHKWAMLDVFVLSLAVLALSSAAAWSAILLEGFVWFLAYFFIAGALGASLSHRNRIVNSASTPTSTL